MLRECVSCSSAGKCLHECERGSAGRGGMRRGAVWQRGEGGGVRRSRAGRGEWQGKGEKIKDGVEG